MLGLLTAALPIVVQIIGFFVMRNQQAKESQAKFLAFIQAMENEGLISKKLHDSYEEQRRKNKEELEKGQ